MSKTHHSTAVLFKDFGIDVSRRAILRKLSAPACVNIHYGGPMQRLFLNEACSQGQPVWERGETIKLNGTSGHYDERFGMLDFVLGSTEIRMSGSPTNEELIDIAKSMKPAAPLAE